MRHAVELVGIVNLVLFAAIAVVCVRQWRSERAVTALWAALAFVTLAWVVVSGRVLPQDPEDLAGKVVQRLDVVILVLFPYLLYRFATAFEPTRRPLAHVVDALSCRTRHRDCRCSRPCPPRESRGRGGSSSTRSRSSCIGPCC